MGLRKQYGVAASGQWTDEEDGRRRLPAAEVPWEPGLNQTVRGLSLSLSRMSRFLYLSWPETFPGPCGTADRVRRVCPRCASVTEHRGGAARFRWHRTRPRP